MKKILIIGGCGYIGSALFLSLQKKYDVTTVDLEWFGNPSNPQNIKKEYADLSRKFLSEFEVIILLAGHSSVAMAVKNRLASFQNNVAKFVELLDKLDDQLFIYASSAGIYGTSGEQLIAEDTDHYIPTNYYDLQKKEIDYYSHLSNLNYVGLRFGTVNGYAPNLRTDVMINKMYATSLKTKEIHVANGQLLRPLLGIKDLCTAVEKIIQAESHPGIYNLASFNMTIGEIAKQVAKKLQIPVIEEPATPAYSFSIATQKIEQTFDFTPTETVASIVKSLQENFKKAQVSIRE